MIRRRRVRVVLLFVLLGAIVNVAVAWGCAIALYQLPVSYDFCPSPKECITIWTRYGKTGLPSAPTRMFADNNAAKTMASSGGPRRTDRRGVTQVVLFLSLTEVSGPPGGQIIRDEHWIVTEIRAGWPGKSMRGGTFFSKSSLEFYGIDGFLVTVGTIPVSVFNPIPTPDQRLVPYKPIWPGFAINTIFYAGVLWMMFAFPLVLRRRRRIKRGLCPACAYPVGNSPVCTECGKPVTPRSVAPS